MIALFLILYGAIVFAAGLFLGAYIHAGNPSHETPTRPAVDEPDMVYYERTDIRA